MSLPVSLLVLASASIHVFWNALVKESEDKVSLAWLTTLAGTLMLVPVFLVLRTVNPGPLSPALIACAAVSGLFEALYMILLFHAYDRVDLSTVYPLSRGFAPVVTLAAAGILTGDRTGPLGVASVVGILLGARLVGTSALADAPDPRRARNGVALALGTGCMIAGYHLTDRKAMLLDPQPSTGEYFCLMHLFLLAFLFAFVWSQPRYRTRAWSEWGRRPRTVLVTAVLILLAYFLIVLALRLGNVTYVAGGRNVGIVLSIAVGRLRLKEPVCRRRVAGAVLILLGVIGLLLPRAGT